MIQKDPAGDGLLTKDAENMRKPEAVRLPQDLSCQLLSPEYDAGLAALIRYNLKKHGLDIPGTVYFDEGLDHLSSFYLAKPDERPYEILLDKNCKLVGGIGLAEFPFVEGCAELQKLYLADSVKGNGIGYYLIRLIEEKASALGYTKVYVETHSNLQAAIHIYTKAGYQRMDRPDFVQHGTMDTFFLKDLADNRH